MQQTIDALSHLDVATWLALGDYAQDFDAGLDLLRESKTIARIWGQDGTLWADDPEIAQAIEERMGWLDLPASMRVEVLRLKALALEVQAAGIERIVLLGMGGSSLAPEVMDAVLGGAPGHPRLTVLDSTDPSQIRRVAQEGPLSRALFVVASKSGETAETLSLCAYFRSAVAGEVGADRAPNHFVAIADAGTQLEQFARSEGFRAVYVNPSDVGGRYSALSLFGLVPAALVGADLNRLLIRAKEMAWACRGAVPVRKNPAVLLGAFLGTLSIHHTHPRDKLTLLATPRLASFVTWAEQLIAESTGKRGRGIVPVEAEFLDRPSDYGQDRMFAYLRLDGADNERLDATMAGLVAQGHPAVVLRLADVYDLGAEFFRWEFATAVAGRILGVNPFDQPDVEASKSQARKALARYEETHRLSEEQPAFEGEGLSVYGPPYVASSAGEYLAEFFAQACPGDYVALMAYIERDADHSATLGAMRQLLAERLGLAATVGFGPRFLHSTGQLHKGGPATGLFVQITHEDAADVAIPGHSYSFGVLKHAQALGDLDALRGKERRVVRCHLGVDVEAGLQMLLGVLTDALVSE